MRVGLLVLVYSALTVLILIGWSLSQQDTQDISTFTATQLVLQADSTLTPTAGPPASSTPLPTSPATATSIPVPTVAAAGGAEAVTVLFETNNGCEFPCWWGIVPGVTRWDAAEAFLTPFAIEFRQVSAPVYLEDGAVEHQIIVPVPENVDDDGLGTLTIVEDWWGFVRSINLAANFAALGYGLFDLLEQFGPPQEILVAAQGRDPANLEAFGNYILSLSYPERGMMMAYFGVIETGNRQDETLEICLSDLLDSFSWLLLWAPDNPVPPEMLVAPGLFSAGELVYSPIGDISGISADDFFAEYSDQNLQDFCFEVTNPDFSE